MELPTAFCTFCFLVGLADAGFSTPPHRLADREFLSKQTKVVNLLLHVDQPDVGGSDNQSAPFSLEESADRFQEPALAQRLAAMHSRGLLQGRGQPFSLHRQADIEQAVATVQLLLSAQDFDTFYSAATWAKHRLSEALFSYAFTVAVLHRNDTSDVVLPAPYELWPRHFVDSDVMRWAYDARLRGGAADGDTPQVVATGSGPRGRGCPEEMVSYFREDVGLRAHWAANHLRCPFWLPASTSESSCHRRGELFYFRLRQLAARYDLERLSAGLEPVQPLQYPSVYQETYDSGERFPSESRCAAEGDVFLPDTPHVRTLKILEERILDAIDAGYVVDRNYTEHSLRMPESIEILGNIVEGNADSVNRNFYGSLYRGLLTSFSHNEDVSPAKQAPNFMENPATALRDPLFYRAVKKLLEVFNHFQDRMRPYKREERNYTEHSLRMPESIEILGNIVEGNADSVNRNFYGSLYRGLLTSFSHNEDVSPAKQAPNFMENPATALRDPLFYRAVKKLLEVFNHFQDRMRPYKREELEFPGVRVEGVFVKSLSTHLERFEFELDNALPALNASRPRLLASQRRLTARPFQYQLAVASQHDADVDALLRVYLGPRRSPGQLERDRHRFVLFDAFRASLSPGVTTMRRTYKDLRFHGRPPLALSALRRRATAALSSGWRLYVDDLARPLGGVERLSLPRGWRAPNGLPLSLLVVVSPVPGTSNTTTAAVSFPPEDGRPAGFPLDRPIVHNSELDLPNVRFEDITIVHRG